MTKAKFKVTDDMVDAAFATAVVFEDEQACEYESQQDEQRGFIKAVIQAAADQWLQTKGGGYVSLGDYNSISKSYALLCEGYDELSDEYYTLVDKYEVLRTAHALLQEKYWRLAELSRADEPDVEVTAR